MSKFAWETLYHRLQCQNWLQILYLMEQFMLQQSTVALNFMVQYSQYDSMGFHFLQGYESQDSL